MLRIARAAKNRSMPKQNESPMAMQRALLSLACSKMLRTFSGITGRTQGMILRMSPARKAKPRATKVEWAERLVSDVAGGVVSGRVKFGLVVAVSAAISSCAVKKPKFGIEQSISEQTAPSTATTISIFPGGEDWFTVNGRKAVNFPPKTSRVLPENLSKYDCDCGNIGCEKVMRFFSADGFILRLTLPGAVSAEA